MMHSNEKGRGLAEERFVIAITSLKTTSESSCSLGTVHKLRKMLLYMDGDSKSYACLMGPNRGSFKVFLTEIFLSKYEVLSNPHHNL